MLSEAGDLLINLNPEFVIDFCAFIRDANLKGCVLKRDLTVNFITGISDDLFHQFNKTIRVCYCRI